MEQYLEKYMDDANLDGASESVNSEESTATDNVQAQGPTDEVKDDLKAGEKSIEDQLNDFKIDDKTPSELLDQINSLGLLRKGLPVEFQNVDEIKEALGKGFDYTQKTQELAKERETWKSEMETSLKEIEAQREQVKTQNEQLKNITLENEVMSQAIDELEQNEPELFEVMKSYFQKHYKQYNQNLNNPALSAMEGKINDLNKTIEELKGTKVETEHQAIRGDWEKGITEVQKNYGPKLKQLGIKPDWKKVESHWAADATGKVDVKNAFYAVYGEQIAKALENQKKLLETKSKSDARVGKPLDNSVDEKTALPHERSDSYLEHLKKIADRYAS